NPTPAPTITGTTTVCEYKHYTYTTNASAGNTYLWNVTGGDFVGSNTSSSVEVKWNSTGAGTISVTQTNAFSCDSSVSTTITINPTPAPTITGTTTVCEYKHYTYTTNASAGNTYLWNVTGGTIVGSNAASSVEVKWNANGAGSISVRQTNAFSCDSTVSTNITITPTPAPTITGSTTVCEYKHYTYTTNTSAGNTYLWNVTGGTIVGTNAASSVEVKWNANGAGTISVTQTNAFSCDSMVSTNITITPTPAPIITGNTSVCENKQYAYATNTATGYTYQWNVNGGSIVGSSNDSLVIVNWNTNGLGSVSLTQTNAFNCDSTVSRSITIRPTPSPTILGDTQVCAYGHTTYTTNTSAGHTYQWFITGGIIVGSNNSASVDIHWGAPGTGSVSVMQTNLFTCDSILTIPVSITSTPTPEIKGDSTVCAFKHHSYSTNGHWGNAYQWNVSGGTIIGSSTDTLVEVKWNTSGSGSIGITEINSFLCDASRSKAITIRPTPTPSITGDTEVCANKHYTYSTNFVAGDNYQWNVTGGTITGSSSSSSVEIKWDTAGVGLLSITQSNAFNCDSTISLNVSINPTPAPIINGSSTVCAFREYTYSTNAFAGHTYLWNVTGGTILGSNSDTVIHVKWNVGGSGSIRITQTNSSICDSSLVRTISIQSIPQPSISGDTLVCVNNHALYTTNTNPGYTYQWSVTGGDIVGSSTDSTVEIKWGILTSGTISVKQINASGCDSTVTTTIHIQPTPGANLSGPTTVCEYKHYTYHTNPSPGHTYYWSAIGGTIIGSNTDTVVHINWNTKGNGVVSVSQTNSLFCDSTFYQNITIKPTPVPEITGITTVCEFKQYAYSTSFDSADFYFWNVTGGVIVGSNTESLVIVKWDSQGIGSISVTQTSPTACDSTVSKSIIIRLTPAPAITGPVNVCEYKKANYSTNFVVGNTYQWTVTGGTIIGNSTASSIDVLWNSTGNGMVSVLQTNLFACDSVVTVPITIAPTPVPILTGDTSVCEYNTHTYYTNPSAGNTYQWNVTGGSIIGSNTDTLVLVKWNKNGAGSISVSQTNILNCDSTLSKSIFIRSTPAPDLVGDSSVCEFKHTIYYTHFSPGFTYLWSVTGGTITGSNTDTLVNVKWDSSGIGIISMKQINMFGCDSTVSRNIVIQPTPVPGFNGPDHICAFKQAMYTTSSLPGNTYSWSVTGGTVLGNSNDTFILVKWGDTSIAFVELKQTNGSGCDSTISKNVIIHPTPPLPINGSLIVCEHRFRNYSIPAIPGTVNTWSITGGEIKEYYEDTLIRVQWHGRGTGSLYLHRINLAGCDTSVNHSILIDSIPAPVITGPQIACRYKPIDYSVYNADSMIGHTYHWTITGGAIYGSDTNKTVVVKWDTSGSGILTLQQTNTSGCDSSVFTSITIRPTPIPLISGSDTVCRFRKENYSTNTTPGHQYQWNISGGTIIGNDTDTAIQVKWDDSGTGMVSIYQINTFGCDSLVTVPVQIAPMPLPEISGPDTVCEFKHTAYSIASPAGFTNEWIISGGIIVGDPFSNTVQVKWGVTGPGTIYLKQTSSLGCDTLIPFSIFIRPTPLPVIQGPDSACSNTQAVYHTNPDFGNTYLWEVIGGTILGMNNDTQVQVLWSNGGGGIVRVTQINSSGCDSTAILHVKINAKPMPLIIGDSGVCEFKQYNYHVNALQGSTYQWSINNGLKVGTNADTLIRVEWQANGLGLGNIRVIEINKSGCDTSIQIAVTIHPTPVPFFIGPDSSCAHKNVVYSTPSVPGIVNTWSVLGGIITGDIHASSVNILWGLPGTGTITLTQTNPFGCDSSLTKPIQIFPTPVPAIVGSSKGCTSTDGIYKALPAGNYLYQWNITSTDQLLFTGNNDQIIFPWTEKGTYKISLTMTDPNTLCDSTVFIHVTVDSVFKPVIESNTLKGCLPLYVTFSGNDNTGGVTYLWDFGDGSFSSKPNPEYVYTKPGTYQLKVKAINSSGCKDSASTTVKAHHSPKAQFDYTHQNEIIYAEEDTVHFINKSFGGNRYLWELGEGNTDSVFNTKHTYNKPGIYNVYLQTIDTLSGCTSVVTKSLEVNVHELVFVPNAFTPNGDGINDLLYLGLYNITEFELSIYDRWGGLIFKSTDINNQWDGTYHGNPVQTDVYVYLLHARGLQGKYFAQTGHITLIR
ncbi:MAG: gliding motility-associated C-terminal domain-containing protein, partial [Bacteroidia bacterium]